VAAVLRMTKVESGRDSHRVANARGTLPNVLNTTMGTYCPWSPVSCRSRLPGTHVRLPQGNRSLRREKSTRALPRKTLSLPHAGLLLCRAVTEETKFKSFLGD
jgi:hypothetical protein